MITGSLKNKIDAIRQDFYNENMSQGSDVVNQLTTLMFIKMLDDRQNALEAQASVTGMKLKEEDLIFKKGNYINEEENVNIPYDNLRWHNFKDLNSKELAKRIRDYCYPFIKDEHSVAGKDFSRFTKNMSYGFDGKERLLLSVVDKLSDSEFNFTKTDLMGDLYEYLCSSGISGQFRTPRHIIDLAVELMKPQLGERIIDNACGTAGFLVESAKYIQEHQKKELLNIKNKQKYQEAMFFGCDTDNNMARISYMNMVLHGVKKPNIMTDSLIEGENAKDLFGTFDLSLNNPPFAGAIPDDSTSADILAITKTSKTELLFVALMIKMLKIGGRCATIVPDGVLFGSSKAHVSLRQELVENQKLIAVISMPAGVFMASSGKGSTSKGSGVKTSYLIFQRTDQGGTDNVWFYDMKADGFSFDAKRTETDANDIPDIIRRYENLSEEMNNKRTDQSFMVPKAEIVANGYDLTVNKYKEIVKEEKVYRASSEITNDIISNELEIIKGINLLEKQLGLPVTDWKKKLGDK